MIKINKPFKALLYLLGAAICAPSIAAQAVRPNIIIILADDLGYNDVGFNAAIQKVSTNARTPKIDDLAANGTVFTSAYVTHPFCGPSRASLMTGRYAHNIGSQYNVKHGTGKGIPANEAFMSDVLQSAGYHTGVIGKWHLGEEERFTPNQRGFDEFYGFLGGGHNYFDDPSSEGGFYGAGDTAVEYSDHILSNDKVIPTEEREEYLTDELSKQAVNFVAKNSGEKPFFLFMSYNAPHTPIQATDADKGMFPHITNAKLKTYAAMTYAMDRGIGKIVDQLKASGEFDNTLIVFLSDNGGKKPVIRPDSHELNIPLRGRKGDAWEGGFRVPMFFHWPDAIGAGKTFDRVVSSLDLFPTFATLAGATIPANKALDGKDLWGDYLNGKGSMRDSIFVLRHREGLNDNVGVRKGKWKAVKHNLNGTDKWRLFDVEADIAETNDLSQQHPAILKSMAREAQQWSRDHKEPLFFDSTRASNGWKVNNMPRYDEIFKVK